MKGVVLWPKPDRHPLARATNTNENPGKRVAGMGAFYTSFRGCQCLAAVLRNPCINMAASALSSIRRAGAP
jgi:hypothetical protein